MGNIPNNINVSNNNRRSVGSIINRVFESAGPDGKVRGTPQQIIDKYQALARDAQLAGDRVAAESFLQHSEHYSRLLGEAMPQQGDTRQSYDRDDAPREEPRRDDDRRDDDPRGDAFTDQGRDPQAEQPRSQPHRDPQPRTQQPRDQQPRDQQPRDQQPRDQQQRDQQQRDQQPRPQQRDEGRQRPEQKPNPRPQPLPVIASSLTTIDPSDEGEFGGLIETPESAAPVAPLPMIEPMREPPVEAAPTDGVNGGAHLRGDDAPADPPKPKRGRPRKKAPASDADGVASSTARDANTPTGE